MSFAIFRQLSAIIGKTVEKLKNDIFNAPTRQHMETKTFTTIIVDKITFSRKKRDYILHGYTKNKTRIMVKPIVSLRILKKEKQ